MEKSELEFETLKSNKNRLYLLCGIVCVVVLLITIIVSNTFAKYRVTDSVPLIDGVINYTPYDFKVMAMYQESDTGEYVEIEEMPSSGYVINEEKSYCTLDNVNKDEESILYTNENGEHVFSGLKKSSKCYLYFDIGQTVIGGGQILDNYLVQLTRDDFSTTVTETTTGTIYYADTSKGRTYYFAGNPTDNWVYFAGFWWRIIRINEDGSIRMIYNGKSTNVSGEETLIGESAFHTTWGKIEWSGYMYQEGQTHGLQTDSTVKKMVDDWYASNLLYYTQYLSTEAGFCGDREPSTSSSTSNGSGGTGITTTYYGAYIRLVNSSKNPTFECQNDSDLYTVASSSDGNRALIYPIGLISADEIVYAGGSWESSNKKYFLYNNQTYWTMSPYQFDGSDNHSYVFRMYTDGSLDYWRIYIEMGVRPVINLKADVILSGSGTTSDPYQVEGA